MAGTPNHFRPGRNQDAWATLRGFKYQIDLSLLRWLEIGDHEHLELERGEDIDRIARSVTCDDEPTFERLLEQVKHRAESITLRSREALECLCNAVAHAKANPDLKLHFCYTSNAAIAPERPNPFPNRTPGLNLWERARKRELDQSANAEAIQSIANFLRQLSRPSRVSIEAWDGLQNVASDVRLIAILICRFQWNCCEEECDDLGALVQNQILAQTSGDRLHAESLYQRLTLVVIQLLSAPGLKRLTRPMLLDHLAAPTLSNADRNALMRLQDRFSRMESRMDAVEDAITVLKSNVKRMRESSGVSLGEIDAVQFVSVEPPPTIPNLVKRPDTVKAIASTLAETGWLSLVGAVDEGKSQLANLLAPEFGGCGAWIQFNHAMETSRAAGVLLRALLQLGRQSQRPGTLEWFRCTVASLAKSGCLVLDDLPRLNRKDEFPQHLGFLAKACREVGTTVISTSRFAFPAWFKSEFPRWRFCETKVPHFTELEVKEMLLHHDAPDDFVTQSNVEFVFGFTFGHPLLVTVAAQYLRDADWDSKRLVDLIDNEHAAGLADEVLNRLCDTLDDAPRELVYRMSLSDGPIHDDVAVELGGVETQIEKPRESLARLIGAWVQRESPKTSRVSPLLNGLAKPTLPSSTFRGCHAVLASAILRKPLSPWDAQDAVRHLIDAYEVDQGGLVFLSLLEKMREWKVYPELRPLLLMWGSTPLPGQMFQGLKLVIRTLQFLVFPKYSVPDEYVLQDLDELMNQLVEEDASSAYVVASFAVLFLAERDYVRSVRFFRLAMQAITASHLDLSQINLLRKDDPAELIWLPILCIESEEHLKHWLQAFDSLNDEQRMAVVQSKDAALGAVVLADRLIFAEASRAESERNWDSVLSALKSLESWAEERGWEHLVSCAVKARVNVHGEHLRTPKVMEDVVTHFCADRNRSERAKSIVANMYGRELAGISQYREAIPWLERAIQHPVDGLGHNQLMAYLAAVLCYGSTKDFEKAIDVGRHAIELADSDVWISDIEAVKAYGEVAIANLRGKETKEAALAVYPIWCKAVERMYSVGNRDDYWKDNFVVFAHVHSFLVNVAVYGTKAKYASDGSEYVAPYLGMFFKTVEGRIDFYDDASIPTVMWMHSRYARAAADFASADEWLLRADMAISSGPMTFPNAAIRGDMIPHFLASDKYPEALEAAFESSRSMVASEQHHESNRFAIPHGTTVDSLFDKLSPEKRALTDPFAIISGVVPAFFRIGRLAFVAADQADAQAMEIATVCSQIARLANVPAVWEQASRLFNTFGTHHETHGRSNMKLADFSQSCRGIQILSYFVYAHDHDLQTAFTSHLVGLAHAHDWYRPKTPIFDELFTPYLVSFWQKAFENLRFEFSTPRIAEEDLRLVRNLPVEEQARATLNAVRSSFSLGEAGGCADWLDR